MATGERIGGRGTGSEGGSRFVTFVFGFHFVEIVFDY